MIQVYIRVKKEIIESLSRIEIYEEKIEILKEKEESISIDKTWEFLSYLLTGDKYGNDHYLSKLFIPKNSTIEISEDDSNYILDGKDMNRIKRIYTKIDLNTSYLTPIELEKIFVSLKEISVEELFNNCDFDEVRRQGIYPGVWNKTDDIMEYLMVNYLKLFEFLKKSINTNSYVIVECD